MSEIDGNNFRRKRKANEMDEQNFSANSWMASEEEMKARRIVKVIRNEKGEALTNDKTPNQSEEKSLQNLEKRDDLSIIKQNLDSFNKHQNTKEESKPKISVVNQNNSTEKNENKIQNVKKNQLEEKEDEGKITTLGKKFNNSQNPFENNPEKMLTFSSVTKSSNTNPNPFTKKDNSNKDKPDEIKNPFLPTNKQDTSTISNSFTNPFTNKTFTNPYSNTTSFLNTKPTFNFNLNQASSNPNWEDEEEDDKDNNINPEEEVGIKGESSSPVIEISNPNQLKHIKMSLDDLSIYNFEEKKYKSKGKGELSIDLIRTDKDIVLGYLVYRNSALLSLFNAQIVKSVSTFETSAKNFRYFGVVQKLMGINETTNKSEIKAVRLSFINQKDSENFKEKFDETLKVLVKNDLSLFPENKKVN
jgi:hypothetical protein